MQPWFVMAGPVFTDAGSFGRLSNQTVGKGRTMQGNVAYLPDDSSCSFHFLLCPACLKKFPGTVCYNAIPYVCDCCPHFLWKTIAWLFPEVLRSNWRSSFKCAYIWMKWIRWRQLIEFDSIRMTMTIENVNSFQRFQYKWLPMNRYFRIRYV